MKFKVGDRVESKEFGKGTVVEIETGSLNNSILVKFDKKDGRLHNGQGCAKKIYTDNSYWFYNKSDKKNLKLIKPKRFTKSDLQDGDIVTYRNRKKRVKQGNTVVCQHEWNDLDYYKDDLTNKTEKKLDIVKVERPTRLRNSI